MTPELRDFARRVVAKATELDEVGVLDDWLQVFIELAKDDEDAAREHASDAPSCSDCGAIMEPCGAIAPHYTFQCPNCGRKVHGINAAQPGSWREPDATGPQEATADCRKSPSSAPAATLGEFARLGEREGAGVSGRRRSGPPVMNAKYGWGVGLGFFFCLVAVDVAMNGVRPVTSGMLLVMLAITTLIGLFSAVLLGWADEMDNRSWRYAVYLSTFSDDLDDCPDTAEAWAKLLYDMAELSETRHFNNTVNLTAAQARSVSRWLKFSSDARSRAGVTAPTSTPAVEGAGSSAPAAGTLPPLDAALVEECAQIHFSISGSRNNLKIMEPMRAALTHYRERVEKPLREELRLIDEAAYGHHVPEERQVGLLYRVCRLRSSVEQLTDDAAKHVEKMRGQRQHNRDVNRALTIRDAELSTSRAEADRLRAELNQYDERGHDAQLEIDRLRGELESEKVASRRYADSTDTAIACGSHDDPTAGNCGECRACVVAERDRLRRELADMEKRKDGAYEERNRVVALLAALYPSKRCRTAIEGWSDDWHGCVYIETPEGQLSWHYHDSQASMFAHVPEGAASWDGHTTEEKYRRVDRLCVNAAPAQRFTQPTDEERQRLAGMMRHFAGSSASGLVSVRADDLRKAATLLEEPPRRHARKSLGRRFVLRFDDGEISTRTHYDLHSAEVCASAAGAEIIECDLVPVEEEKP